MFEEFFTEWQAAGHGSVTTANVADALALFEDVAEAQLAGLPEADRALERTQLLGSAAAAGLAERAFAFEIEQGGEVVERLLEHELEGEFAFAASAGSRTVRLRAKADRIDLLADGTLRVDRLQARQGAEGRRARCSCRSTASVREQSLEGRHGRSWTLGTRRLRRVSREERVRGARRLVVARGGARRWPGAVARGGRRHRARRVPARPDEPFLCTWCGYARVCRKDYVGDE